MSATSKVINLAAGNIKDSKRTEKSGLVHFSIYCVVNIVGRQQEKERRHWGT